MTNNKEEILQKYSARLFKYNPEGLLSAVDEYAKQVAIEFGNFCGSKDLYFENGLWYETFLLNVGNKQYEVNYRNGQTTEQLYSLWEQTKK